jgi:hypothetical protein
MSLPTMQAPPAPTRKRTVDTFAVVLAVVVAAAFLGAARLTRGPDFVDHVRVTNPSGSLVDVEVTGAHRDGWLPITIARAHATTRTEDVVDQGDRWIFRFSRAGRNAGDVVKSRADLERAHWTVVVPSAVIDRLGDDTS